MSELSDKRDVILGCGVSSPDMVLNALHQAGWMIVRRDGYVAVESLLSDEAFWAGGRGPDDENEAERFRIALRTIYQMPCMHPDDPDEPRKLAAQFAEAQRIAIDALTARTDGGEGADPS